MFVISKKNTFELIDFNAREVDLVEVDLVGVNLT